MTRDDTKEIARGVLVLGETRCAGSQGAGQCPHVHGMKKKSAVSGAEYTIVFTKAIVVDGLLMPVCDTCAIISRVEALPIEKAIRLLEQQLAEMATRPQAEPTAPETPVTTATPLSAAAAPAIANAAPAMPIVGKVTGVRKDAAVQQRQVPRKEPQPKRAVQLPPQVAAHLKSFEMATKFEKAIETREEGRCSAKCCSAKAGEGFVVRDDKRFPLCDAGLRAAGIFSARQRDAGAKRSFFYYRSEREQQEREQEQAARKEADIKQREADAKAWQAHAAKISKEILAKRFANTSRDVCAVFACEAPKPRVELRTFDATLGDDVKHRICGDCADVAVELDRKLSREQRFFSVARPGEKRPAPRPQRKPQPKAKASLVTIRPKDVSHDVRAQVQAFKARIGATPPPAAAEAPKAELPRQGGVEISQTPVEETGTKSQEGDSTIN